MMWSLSKALIATATVGSIDGVAAYAGGLFNSEENLKVSIKDKLEKEGFKTLNTDISGGDWAAVLADYKNSKTKSFSGQQESDKEEIDLRKKCKEIFSLESSNDYSKARMWCVKKEKMNEIIKRTGYLVLKSNENVLEGEKAKWEEKIRKWKIANPQPFQNIKDQIKDEPDDTNNVQLFRGECEKLKINQLDTTSEEFEINFNLAKKWCSFK